MQGENTQEYTQFISSSLHNTLHVRVTQNCWTECEHMLYISLCMQHQRNISSKISHQFKSFCLTKKYFSATGKSQWTMNKYGSMDVFSIITHLVRGNFYDTVWCTWKCIPFKTSLYITFLNNFHQLFSLSIHLNDELCQKILLNAYAYLTKKRLRQHFSFRDNRAKVKISENTGCVVRGGVVVPCGFVRGSVSRGAWSRGAVSRGVLAHTNIPVYKQLNNR